MNIFLNILWRILIKDGWFRIKFNRLVNDIRILKWFPKRAIYFKNKKITIAKIFNRTNVRDHFCIGIGVTNI